MMAGVFLGLGALIIVPILVILVNRGAEEQFTKLNRLIGWTWGLFWLFALCTVGTGSDGLTFLIKLDLIVLSIVIVVKLIKLVLHMPVKSNVDILDENM